MTAADGRTADHPIDAMFHQRCSPRAFIGEPLVQTDLLTTLEAARWAPSGYSPQWRFRLRAAEHAKLEPVS